MPPTLQHRASVLILGYLQDTLSPSEKQELDAWLAVSEQHRELFAELTDTNRLARETAELDGLKNRIAAKIYEQVPAARQSVPLYHRGFFRVAAAAAILIGLIATCFFVYQTVSRKKTMAINTTIPAPQTSRALIRLADGSEVYLDSIAKGQLVAMQDNVKLVRSANGQIVYETTGSEAAGEMKYNTLSNPRGSKVIDFILSDGSHIWLNAGSSVTYPVAFTGNERKVQMNGEIYFEVAPDKEKPFRVIKGETTVEVLGTHFNVNAYDDEAAIKVTLLEGAVNVNSIRISPGQQAQVSNNIKVVDNVDTEQVIIWKNGWFQFNSLPVDAIMREISRWYDVDVEYTIQPGQKRFSGILSRNSNVSDVLKIMEQANIHFKIEGRKIKVIE